MTTRTLTLELDITIPTKQHVTLELDFPRYLDHSGDDYTQLCRLDENFTMITVTGPTYYDSASELTVREKFEIDPRSHEWCLGLGSYKSTKEEFDRLSIKTIRKMGLTIHA